MTDPGPLALLAWLLPAAAFLLLGVAVPLRRSAAAGWTSVLLAGAALWAAFAAWRAGTPGEHARILWEWLPMASGPLATVGVLVDADSALMLLLVAGVSFLVQLYSLGYLEGEPPGARGRYFAYQSLFAFSMMGLVLAPGFVQLFVCWELVGLCSYLLIGYWYQRPEAARAAVKAFWITKAGDVGLLVGIVLLWRHAGTLDYLELLDLVDAGTLPLAGLELITVGIYLGAMGKSAQFPLHVWLPDAMEGPTPVSALIHAATMVTAGVYLFTRTIWLFAQTPEVLAAVGWIGAFTALLAATLACVQADIKRVLAYSTVSQLGYMMAAMGAGYAAAGFHHLLTHGVFKALLFLAAGAVIHAVGTNDIFAMGGLARRMPQTAIVFLVGTLSLAGLPFFGGFFSKEEILGAVWVGGHPVPFLMLAVAAFLTAFYMFRVVFIAFFAGPAPGWATAAAGHGSTVARGAAAGHGSVAGHGPTAGPAAPGAHGATPPGGAAHGPGTAHAHDAPWVMIVPLWILALLSVAIGVTVVPHRAPDFEAPAALPWVAVLLSLGGVALAWLAYQRRAVDPDRLGRALGAVRDAALERFWLDEAFTAVYRLAVLGVARIVGWIDRYLVDGVVNVLSAWTLTSGDRLRRLQTGLPQDYVYAVALGAILLIAWSQWAR